MTAVGYGGSFIAFTYLAPILQEVSGFAPSTVGLVLLVYGISVAIGNIWGGKLADRKGPVGALKIIFLLLAAVLLLLTFTASSPWLKRSPFCSGEQWRSATYLDCRSTLYVRQNLHTPQAVDVASGLNIAAFNLGIAGGVCGVAG